MFLLDQLRWCGKPSHAAEIRAIGAASDAAEVKAFSLVVARELEGLPLAR
jgi:hypothetical protein